MVCFTYFLTPMRLGVLTWEPKVHVTNASCILTDASCLPTPFHVRHPAVSSFNNRTGSFQPLPPMLPVLIRNIHQEVSAQELVDALNNNLPASAHVDKNHITFLSTGRSRSTILLFRRKSALRSIKKGPLPVLHGQEINIDTNFYGLNVLSEGTGPVIEYVARVL